MANKNTNGYDDEEMTVELELDDGQMVNCAIITILTVDKKDYIVLLPLDEDGNNDDGEVWFYRYSENEDDPNAEPELSYIDDDDEYENYMAYLEEKNNELEEIVVPYMTEAAQAINIALIKTEIKEIEGREGKRILSSKNINLAGKSWMRRRLAMVAKMHPEITPVKNKGHPRFSLRILNNRAHFS